ncbi:hypothetical cytosolic protein [Candidatus Moduliflexus flocculans]|uniref:Hypothetical cytosolic protein n=1 Tax=Candidatus Moduliflexus flocculans TaxID=1499966 RepID=A0A081BMD1_9BACT|nr:hypothetical cytosolic protein [Candidatus Moduliflexus flocculans]
MPIYEFYCQNCHTIYNFLSRTVNTQKIPNCPTCLNVALQRKVSLFSAISGGKKEESEGGGDADLPPGFDEAKMEKAMGMLAKEAEHLDENDPRQAAQLMRKLSDATGLTMGPAMEEALHRMERGEDPDKIEAEMGDLLESEEPFLLDSKGSGVKGERRSRPNVDDKLYEL